MACIYILTNTIATGLLQNLTIQVMFNRGKNPDNTYSVFDFDKQLFKQISDA